MADQRSAEMFAFIFAIRTSSYRKLAQGLSRYVFVFSSLMREYLDAVVKAYQCAQNVDEFGIRAKTARDLSRNNRIKFKCILKTALKLTKEKWYFGVRQVEFLGRTISPRKILTQARRIHVFLDKFRFSKTKKALQRYLRFINYYRNCIPRMAKKLAENLQAFENRSANEHHVITKTNLWLSEQNP